MKNNQYLMLWKGLLLSVPVAIATMAVPVVAEALSITNTSRITNINGERVKSLTDQPDQGRNGREFTYIFQGTGENPINSRFVLRGSSWLIEIDNSRSNRDIWFSTFGRVEDRKIRSELVSPGTYILNSRKGIIGKNKKVKLTATAVPEPFSTTAAVGLAIAGVTRTLKKKKTDDA